MSIFIKPPSLASSNDSSSNNLSTSRADPTRSSMVTLNLCFFVGGENTGESEGPRNSNSSRWTLSIIIGGGFVTPRVHSGLTYPASRARLRPPLGRAGGSLAGGGFAPASHEAVRLKVYSGAVGEGPLRTPAYLRGRGVTFLTVGAALRVGLRAPSPRHSAGWRGVAPAPPLGSWGWGRPFG